MNKYKLYAFATPNSIKAIISLEELGLDYEVAIVNIRQGEQRAPGFTQLNANSKVPVLVVPDEAGGPFALSESAAILVYLAERHESLLPTSGVERARAFEQLFFHASGLSPAFGQSGFFQKLAAEQLPLAIQRFHGEAQRTLGILNGLLANRTYVAGEHYSIADIAHFGWIWRRAFAGVDFSATPNVARWYETILARPAVQRAIAVADALTPAV